LTPTPSRPTAALTSWLLSLWPAPTTVNWHERLRVVVGATLGMLVTALLSQAMGGPSAVWLVAPMGASAVLVFAVPSSPMAQPWPVVGGNAVSALVGVLCVLAIGPPAWRAAAAVGGAIALMFALRCLHPPGAASALLVALSGIGDPRFALFPVLVNATLLAATGLAYNGATRKHPAPAAPRAETTTDADLDAVLARYNQVLDIGRDDLKALLEDTQLQTYQRKLANLRCGDIMSRQPVTVGHGTPLHAAWALFREHRVKALPVVAASGHIIGIVTPADFLRGADTEAPGGFVERLLKQRGLAKGAPPAADVPAMVAQIMTRQVRVVSADRHLSELIPLFGSSGHHHIPVVDGGNRLIGIITQSDVVAALCRPGVRAV